MHSAWTHRTYCRVHTLRMPSAIKRGREIENEQRTTERIQYKVKKKKKNHYIHTVHTPHQSRTGSGPKAALPVPYQIALTTLLLEGSPPSIRTEREREQARPRARQGQTRGQERTSFEMSIYHILLLLVLLLLLSLSAICARLAFIVPASPLTRRKTAPFKGSKRACKVALFLGSGEFLRHDRPS